MTMSSAPSLRRKSGVSTSTVVAGVASSDGANGRGEMRGTAVGKIVAVDRRHHHMGQAKLGDGLAHPRGLARIERAWACRCAHCRRRKPGAGVAEDHHGRVPLAPALADIRAGRLLAHGVEAVRAQDRARFVEGMRPGALTRIQSGLRRTGVSGSRAFSGWRGRDLSGW